MTKSQLQSELIAEKIEHLKTLDKYKELIDEHFYLQKKHQLVVKERIGYGKL